MMKTSSLSFIVLLVASFASLALTNPAPLLKEVLDLVRGLLNTLTKLLGGTLGGLVAGILGTGLFGNFEKGGCKLENVANVVELLLENMDIQVANCTTNRDCDRIGTERCIKVSAPGLNDVKVCELGY